MDWIKKNLKNGNSWYQFTYYDPTEKKNKKVPKSLSSHIRTDSQADAFCASKEAEIGAVSLRIQMKLRWQKKYHNFAIYLDQYKDDRMEKAPNSYKNHIYYLNQYVLPFFLNEKDANNVLNWYMFFDEFKTHLKTVKKIKGRDTLAFNTKNHCIIALNTFLEFVFNKEKFREALPKCKLFPDHLMNRRTVDDIYMDDEIESVKAHLKANSPTDYDFFVLLLETGMRINEARGLSLDNLLKGEPPHQVFRRAMKQFDIPCLAYLYLKNQPAIHRKSKIRDVNGEIERKDLKAKSKARAEEKARFIPISSPLLFNILSQRRNAEIQRLKLKEFGPNKENYLLFDDVHIGRFETSLKKACAAAKIRYREPHCLRHTFATKFAGLTLGNHLLVGSILGHKKEETTQNYLHLHGLLNKNIEIDKAIVNEDDWGTY